MSVVYKYPLKDGTQVQDVEMPIGAVIVAVGNQFEHICLWAIVDQTESTVKRRIGVVATGQRFDKNGTKYLGTVHLQGSALILHVFEQTEIEPK